MAEPRQFPQSLDAERALLGGLLLDNAQVAPVSELIKPGDFYSPNHGRIFELMLSRTNDSQPLDVLGLVDYAIASGNVEAWGGVAYLSSLPEQCPSTSNLEYYAKIIHEKSIRRQLIAVSAEIERKVMDGEAELSELLDHAEKTVFGVTEARNRKDWRSLGELIDEEWIKLEERVDRKGEVTGLPTGFVDLDRLLSGLQNTDLIILAARPAMGKTAFVLNIAQNAALRAGVGVGVFSLEMGAGQLANRLLCAEARVDSRKHKTGMLDQEEDWPRLEDAQERLFHAPLWIDDTSGLTITQLRSRARRLKAQHPELGLIIIDYLQLMGGVGDEQSREQQIASISRGLKGLAKELNLPVLALSQLNRGVEQRQDKRPMISDLRESGAIEQDADLIMFIYRDEYYTKEACKEPGVAEIIVAKHRHGATDTVKLAFQGQFTRFDNLARPLDNSGYQ